MRSLATWLIAGLLLSSGISTPAQADDPCAVAGTLIAAAGKVGPDGLGGTGRGGSDGIGGTGASDDDGIGGTGARDDDGIGGTGIANTTQPRLRDDDGIGGTGVYGTLTGFGSLCVNGLHIFLDDNTGYERNDQPATREELALGQVLWIEARSGDLGLIARDVTAFSAVIGIITNADPSQNRFSVGTQPVRVAPGAYRVGTGDHPDEELAVGDFVDVSGLRDEQGDIVASRIERLPERTEPFRGPQLEQIVEKAAPGLDFLSIEGYLGATSDPGWFLVSGLDVESPRLEGLRDARVIVSGPLLPDGALRIDRALRLPAERHDTPPRTIPEIKPVPVPSSHPTMPAPDATAPGEVAPTQPKAAESAFPDNTIGVVVPLPDAELDIELLIKDQLMEELMELPANDAGPGKPNPAGLNAPSRNMEVQSINSIPTLQTPDLGRPSPDSLPTLSPAGGRGQDRLPGR